MRGIYENINHIFAHASRILHGKEDFYWIWWKLLARDSFLQPSSFCSHTPTRTTTTHAGYFAEDHKKWKRRLVVADYTWAARVRQGRPKVCLHSAYEIMTFPSICGGRCCIVALPVLWFTDWIWYRFSPELW